MQKGRIYGFVGYNGSGKTVLFKCICGLLYVDAGEIRVNGEKIGREMIKTQGLLLKNRHSLEMNPEGKILSYCIC